MHYSTRPNLTIFFSFCFARFHFLFLIQRLVSILFLPVKLIQLVSVQCPYHNNPQAVLYHHSSYLPYYQILCKNLSKEKKRIKNSNLYTGISIFRQYNMIFIQHRGIFSSSFAWWIFALSKMDDDSFSLRHSAVPSEGFSENSGNEK